MLALGADIGKSAHYTVAVDRDGQTVYSTPVANEESALLLVVLCTRRRSSSIIPGGAAALLLKL
jgi:hypothetical protein